MIKRLDKLEPEDLILGIREGADKPFLPVVDAKYAVKGFSFDPLKRPLKVVSLSSYDVPIPKIGKFRVLGGVQVEVVLIGLDNFVCSEPIVLKFPPSDKVKFEVDRLHNYGEKKRVLDLRKGDILLANRLSKEFPFRTFFVKHSLFVSSAFRKVLLSYKSGEYTIYRVKLVHTPNGPHAIIGLKKGRNVCDVVVNRAHEFVVRTKKSYFKRLLSRFGI